MPQWARIAAAARWAVSWAEAMKYRVSSVILPRHSVRVVVLTRLLRAGNRGSSG